MAGLLLGAALAFPAAAPAFTNFVVRPAINRDRPVIAPIRPTVTPTGAPVATTVTTIVVRTRPPASVPGTPADTPVMKPPRVLPPRLLAIQKLRPEQLGRPLVPRTVNLEIQYELSTDGYTHYHATNRVTWNWDHSDSRIWFCWQDDNPRTVRVAWQAGKLPFPDASAAWEQAPGIVAQGTADRVGALNSFRIDFGLFAPLPLGRKAPAVLPRFAIGDKPGLLRPLGDGSGTKASPLAVGVPLVHYTGPVSFYVRAVPLDAAGKPTGFPSLPIEVSWGPQAGGNIKYTGGSAGPGAPPAVHPAVRITEYLPIRFTGNSYLMLCTQDACAGAFKAGTVYDFTPRPKSGFDQFIDSWGGLFGFIAQVYDWVATAYNQVQNDIVGVIADAVAKLSPELAGAVRVAASAALTYGVAALGMPPTLPCFDELAEMGGEYLVAKILEDAPAVPRDVAQDAVKQMADKAHAASRGAGNPAMLFVPAPSERYRPAILRLEVTNPGSAPTTPMDLSVWTGTFVPSWQDVGDMTGMYYPDGFAPMTVFNPSSIHLPSLAPGAVLHVPVCLTESYVYEKDPNNVKWSCWALGYHQAQDIRVATVLPGTAPGMPGNTRDQQALHWKTDTPYHP
jgi:hypothetical protein